MCVCVREKERERERRRERERERERDCVGACVHECVCVRVRVCVCELMQDISKTIKVNNRKQIRNKRKQDCSYQGKDSSRLPLKVFGALIA